MSPFNFSKLVRLFKVTGWFLKNLILFLGFPPSVQDFFVIKQGLLNARVSGNLDLKFVPFLHIFDGFCGFLIQKGTNCEILNLNNRRLGRLKVHII